MRIALYLLGCLLMFLWLSTDARMCEPKAATPSVFLTASMAWPITTLAILFFTVTEEPSVCGVPLGQFREFRRLHAPVSED